MTDLLVATNAEVWAVDAGAGTMRPVSGMEGHRPTCIAADPFDASRLWCGTHEGGVFRTDDSGATWSPSGLAGERLMSLSASPAQRHVLWAGTEPSRVAGSRDGGESWEWTTPLDTLPSSSAWAFPPRPDTHHVRWVAPHPMNPGRLWVAVEAGALISTRDGGRSWRDKVPGSPYDTHELAIHPAAPETLRVAAGDGYYESLDGGEKWSAPRKGLDVSYMRSVAIDPGDPEVVIVSAASSPRTAYVSGRSDGRVYRRGAGGLWVRAREGWPDQPTIAPLLATGAAAGELWAADERGVHRSGDGGRRWELIARFGATPDHLRALAVLAG